MSAHTDPVVSGSFVAGALIALAVVLGAVAAATGYAAAAVIPVMFLAIGLGAVFAYQSRRDSREGRVGGFGTLISLDLFIGFGIGGVYFCVTPATDARLEASGVAIAGATLLGLVAAATMMLGYNAIDWERSRPNLGRGLAAVMEDANRLVVVVLAETVGWLGRAGTVANGQYFHVTEEVNAGPLTVILAALSGLPSIALFIVVARRWLGGRALGSAWLLLLVEVVWWLPSGTRAPVVSLALGLVVLRLRCGYRIPKVAVALASILAIVVLFPAMAAYRGDDATYARDMKTAAAVALDQTLAGQSVGTVFQTGLSVTLTRFSDVLSAAIVLDQNRDQMKVGSSLATYVLTSPVPRMLVPDKPNPGTFGNEFGRAYGMIAQNDLVTSIAVGAPLHAYMSGGWLLLALFCLGSGMGYAVVERLLTFVRNPVSEGIYASICFTVATSVGTIWPLGFLGLCKSLVISIGTLSVIAVLTRVSHDVPDRGVDRVSR
jgi:hypothetical protein